MLTLVKYHKIIVLQSFAGNAADSVTRTLSTVSTVTEPTDNE